MDEVRQILNHYKTIKSKISYIKNYFEHINIINKKSSELLFRATQIPRDTSWQDENIINLVKTGERQRLIFDQVSTSFSELFININELETQVNDEIFLVENDLSEVIEQNEQRSRNLELAKKAHIESWIKNKDPWITDIKLKLAIKNMFNLKEDTGLINTKISIYNDKFLHTQNLFMQILYKFTKIQKKLFNEVNNFKISNYEDFDKFFDAVSENSREQVESKIINAYDGIINNIGKELSKKNISIYKNIEPTRSNLCKIKKGLTGEYMLFFISVTKSKFAHFFDISKLNLTKYSDLITKLKIKNTLISFFERNKGLTHSDEKLIANLNEEIKNNIDKLIDNIYLSINLKNKIIKIDKEKCIITVDDVIQNHLSSLFGMNILRIKNFNLTSCYELYFSMKKNEKEAEKEVEKNEEIYVNESDKNLVIKIEEENPWID